MLIRADRSCLLIIDVQGRLLPAMTDAETVTANMQILLKAAEVIGVPVLASEQYPKGLGRTVAEVAPLLPSGAVVEKVRFSCLGDAAWARRFQDLGRSQAVLAGLEAHVCVLQTAEHLLELREDVFVVADAVSSRTPANRRAALDRLAAAGARIVSTEMVVFEWLERAGTREFKEVSAFVK
jgi:nicotinamidase-related amidase